MLATGPSNIVGKTTGWVLDSLGIESRWGGRVFLHLSRLALGPTQPQKWVPGLSQGKEWPGMMLTLHASSAVGHERVELYLYSLRGPYILYRASVPVQGCTSSLPLPYVSYSKNLACKCNFKLVKADFVTLHINMCCVYSYTYFQKHCDFEVQKCACLRSVFYRCGCVKLVWLWGKSRVE
jgi:hypothetical protein